MIDNKITIEFLKKCSPYIALERAKIYAPILDVYIKRFELDYCASRQAMFLAQIIHESGCFRYTKELASGEAYEGRKDLGNIYPGDGVKYKGRGLLQITGRANYQEMSMLLDIDLIARPELLEEPSLAVASACQWWNKRAARLNKMADRGDIEGVTRVINGGLNGIVERAKLYTNINNIILQWLRSY